MAPAANAASKRIVPFSEGAKRRYVKDSLLSQKLNGYASGGQSTMPLRKVGLTMGLFVMVTMDVVIASGAPVLSNEEGLYSLVSRIQTVIGNNQAQPTDLNAEGLRHFQRNLGFRYWEGFHTPAVGKTTPNPLFWASPLVAAPAVNKWVFSFYVPYSVNFHQDRHLGILPTSAQGFNANLQIDWEKIENVVTGGTLTITNAVAKVDHLSLDVPAFHNSNDPVNSGNVEKPAFWIFARRSTKYGNVIPGDQKFEIPQGGRLLEFGGIVKANGLRTNKVNDVGVVMAGNDQPLTQSLLTNQAHFAARHKLDLPPGEFNFDLLEDNDEGFSGSYRDTIDTTQLGLLEVLVDVDETADLGTNPAKNSITICRLMQHPINVAI